MRTHESERLLTVGDVARRLGISIATVRRLTAAHDLPVVRVGSQLRYSSHDLDDWLDSNREDTNDH
jgi:excisionase family DNA binding protein